MSINGRFMRLVLFFDLPVTTKQGLRNYRQFVKFLTLEGYIRIQESVFCKLCINIDSANAEIRRVRLNAPSQGDIRILPISERQFQKMIDINESHSLQESITTTNRILVIGGMNDEGEK